MAELSDSGTYVKLPCHVWYDKKADNVHVTSNDKSLPKSHMHMTAKKGTQSDANLRALLDSFGCGPEAAKAKEQIDPATEVSKILDDLIYGPSQPTDQVIGALIRARELTDKLLDEKS